MGTFDIRFVPVIRPVILILVFLSPFVRGAWVMILDRWRVTISRRCIVSTAGGRAFAFPFGPFAAYLLTDAKLQSLVVTAVLSLEVASLSTFVATFSVIKTYGLPDNILLLPIVLHYIVPFPLVWAIVRKCARLPIALSLRTRAAVQDPAAILENSFLFTYGTILFMLPLFLFPMNIVWYFVPLYLLFQALVNWYLVIVRHQDRTNRDSLCDKFD
jgi:hypothetical protein